MKVRWVNPLLDRLLAPLHIIAMNLRTCRVNRPTKWCPTQKTSPAFWWVCGLLIGMGVSPRAVAGSIDLKRDWPNWRGPTRDGIAAPGQSLPTTWSETSNLVWKASIPGRGHSSPTIVGEHIYLATAVPEHRSQSVLCLARATGRLVWTSIVHRDGAESGKHANSSAASGTVASDGEHLYISFLNQGSVYTSALNNHGKLLWQTRVCDFVVHQGFAASPVLHESLVLVSADNRGGGVVAGLDRTTGGMVWSQPRPKIPNYTTPAVIRAAGQTQMVLAGCNWITSLDPLTGRKLWELPGSTEECVVTMVTDGTRVFASGGYPRNHTVAVVADGSKTIAWQNNARVYVPSMIVQQGCLFAVMDAGLAVCWKADTGEEQWKERLGGDFFASPVMADGRIYASNVGGQTFVFEATPDHFRLLAKNQLGDEAYASPVICGNQIFLRHAHRGDARTESLYCLGTSR